MELNELFTMGLQQKLKRKVIGKVFVKVTRNDKLLVKIERDDSDGKLEFKMFVDNFSERIVNGWTTDYASYEVLNEYRQFLIEIMNEKYFYQD